MIFMILIFLIPIALIQSLIHERIDFQKEAINEVSSKWGNEQTISGPVISIPYYDFYQDSSKVTRRIIRFAHFLPDSLNVEGTLFPEMRYRGIYQGEFAYGLLVILAIVMYYSKKINWYDIKII